MATRTKKGHPESYHQCWLSDDYVLRWMTPAYKKRFAKRAGYFGLKVIDEGDHLHVQPRPGVRITPHQYLDAKMALSAMFDFRTTSGYRSPWWNAHLPV